jgi:hypothetical protein
MAPVGASLKIRNVRDSIADSFESSIELDVPILLRWDDWTAASRAYIAEAGDKIDLHSAVRDYAALTDQLTAWLFTHFGALHREDVDAVNELIGEYNLSSSAALVEP